MINKYEEKYYYLKYNEKEMVIYNKGYQEALKKYESPRNTTWIVKEFICKNCDSNLIICQPRPPRDYDYWWYCSNKMCQNHWMGEELTDQEDCSFAKETKIND